MVLNISVWNEESISGGKTCIGKIVFISGNQEVCDSGLLKHCRICSRTIPSAKYILEYHIKVRNCMAILSKVTEVSFVISYRRGAIEICTNYCTQ